jgi:hypothetical protein
MATEKVIVDVEIKASPAITSVKSLKAELRAVTNELQTLEEGSAAFVNAAKKAGELKDKIADTRTTIDAFNPEKKFQALANVVGIAANGFAAMQGAMAIMGSESEDLNKVMAKTQGAIALATGLNGLLGMGDAFKNLKSVAGDALKGIKAGIGATGIGLIVVAVGLLLANWEAISAAVKKSFPIFNDMGKIFDKLREVAYGAGEVIKNAILMPFKAFGKLIQGDFAGALEEIKKGYDVVGNYKKGAEAGIKANEEAAAAEKLDRLIKQKEKELEVERAGGQKTYKHELELNKLKQKAAVDNKDELDKLKQEEKILIAGHNKDLKELEKQKNLKIAAENKAALTFELEALKAKGTRTVNELETQQAIEKKILDADLKNKLITKGEYDRSLEKLEVDKAKFIKDREKGTQDSINLAEKERKASHIEDLKEIAKDEVLSAEERYAALDELNQKGLLSDKQTSDAKLAIAQKEKDAKLQLLDSYANSLNSISELVGKNTVEGKALAIAAATISTYSAIAKTLEANAANTPLAIASSIAIGLAGLAAVKNIIDTPVPTKGGGDGGGGGVVPTIPRIPQSLSGSMLNQNRPMDINNTNTTGKVIVVETDITNTQNKVKGIIRKATIK